MAEHSPSIAVVGSANVDLVAYVDRVPAAGETVRGRRFAQGFGGKGANQAVMAARLGASVAFIGALGDDAYADSTVANFETQGIDTRGIARVPSASGLASIWVEPDGTNRIVVSDGANGLVDPTSASISIARLPALDVIVGQLEISQAATASAFRTARARGGITVLNPAPAADLDPALLADTDWLVPNEPELARLARVAASSDEDLLAAASRLGVRLVVTLGSAGASLVVDGRVERVAAPGVGAIDSTGAGDAFVGAFAVGLGLGLTPVAAVRLGVACASDSVTRAGAQASYPDAAGARKLLDLIVG
ncbi:MAG TPA: ribokinase [Candidatus Limnocylindrales bacterium]|nr:ribokinase [Candidatus Limnocylindrales bacterium]